MNQAEDGKRRHIGGEEKLAILKRVLVGKEPISKICEEFKIQPSQVYQWQATLFERGAAAFERDKDNRRERLESHDRIVALEAKIQRKDSVMAELMEEHVKLKKSLGEA